MKKKLENQEMNKELDKIEQAVNHPSHYTFGKYETIDVIEDTLSSDEQYGYFIGNCIKYISRAKYKGKTLQDLKKAQWYLNRLITNLEKEGECDGKL